MESLKEILMYGLPVGFLGSVFTWIFGRRKRNNDMLSQLQASINMLSQENTKILEENVHLRKENVTLKANQEEMILKLSVLAKEVERLRKVINKRQNNETKVKRNVPADDSPVCHAGRVCGTEDNPDKSGAVVRASRVSRYKQDGQPAFHAERFGDADDIGKDALLDDDGGRPVLGGEPDPDSDEPP